MGIACSLGLMVLGKKNVTEPKPLSFGEIEMG